MWFLFIYLPLYIICIYIYKFINIKLYPKFHKGLFLLSKQQTVPTQNWCDLFLWIDTNTALLEQVSTLQRKHWTKDNLIAKASEKQQCIWQTVLLKKKILHLLLHFYINSKGTYVLYMFKFYLFPPYSNNVYVS